MKKKRIDVYLLLAAFGTFLFYVGKIKSTGKWKIICFQRDFLNGHIECMKH